MHSNLVVGLNTIVIGALLPFNEKYPILLTVLSKSKHPSSNWGFFMTVAGIGMHVFSTKISEEEYEAITKQLENLDKQMINALANLRQYLETRKGVDLDLRSTVGFWVLWNITGNPPTHDESKELAPAIGVYLQKVVSDIAG